MPAVRTPSRSTRGTQEPRLNKSSHSVYLESARSEFSLRKRMPNYIPLSPPATPSPPPSPPSSPVSRTPTRARHNPSTPKKKKAPNAFIVYRSHVLANNLLPGNITHQNDVSVRVAELWRAETDEIKRRFYRLALEEKERMEAQGLLSHGSQQEKPRKSESRAKARSAVRSSSICSSTSEPIMRRSHIVLSSPPPSPQTPPPRSLPTLSSVGMESLNPLGPVFPSEKVPELDPSSELSPLSQVEFDWASGSFVEDSSTLYSSANSNAAGPCPSETDAWGVVRAYFDSHPNASGPSVGMTLSLASDAEDDLASLFAKTLDFRTRMSLSLDDAPHSQSCATSEGPCTAPASFLVQEHGWTPNLWAPRDCPPGQ